MLLGLLALIFDYPPVEILTLSFHEPWLNQDEKLCI